MINFHKNFSIAKIFPSKFTGIFANIVQRKIMLVYSIMYWIDGYEVQSLECGVWDARYVIRDSAKGCWINVTTAAHTYNERIHLCPLFGPQ